MPRASLFAVHELKTTNYFDLRLAAMGCLDSLAQSLFGLYRGENCGGSSRLSKLVILQSDLKNGLRKSFFTVIFNFRSMRNRRAFSNMACSLVISQSTIASLSLRRKSSGMTTGSIFCAWPTRIGRKPSSGIATTTYRPMVRLIGQTQTNSAPTCRIMHRNFARKSEAKNRASLLLRFTFHAPTWPIFLRKQQNSCDQIARLSFMALFD